MTGDSSPVFLSEENIMRCIREISVEEENFRVERSGEFNTIRRDPVKPVEEGTIILIPMRVTGYDSDCDGGLMARLSALDVNGRETGWEQNCIGLYPDTGFIVTEEELNQIHKSILEKSGMSNKNKMCISNPSLVW